MKKILLLLAVLTATISISSQEIVLNENGKVELKKDAEFVLPEKMTLGNATAEEAQLLIDSKEPRVQVYVSQVNKHLILDGWKIIIGKQVKYKEIYWDKSEVNKRITYGKPVGDNYSSLSILFIIMVGLIVVLATFPKTIDAGSVELEAPRGMVECKLQSQVFLILLIVMGIVWTFSSFHLVMILTTAFMVAAIFITSIYFGAIKNGFIMLFAIFGFIVGGIVAIVLGANVWGGYPPAVVVLMPIMLGGYVGSTLGNFYSNRLPFFEDFCDEC